MDGIRTQHSQPRQGLAELTHPVTKVETRQDWF